MSAGDELGVRQRGGPDRAVDQARDQALQLEAAVVAPGEAREVAPRVLRADPAVGAGDRRLDVAERGVDPPERRPARRPLAAAGHHGGVLEAGLGRRGPAAQPVGDQPAGRGQALGHELPDLLLAEAFHRQQLDLARAAVVARRHCRHERLLAGGTPAPPPRAAPNHASLKPGTWDASPPGSRQNQALEELGSVTLPLQATQVEVYHAIEEQLVDALARRWH